MATTIRTALRLALAGALALSPGWALAYRPVNRNEVIAISDSVWEVVSRGSSRASGFWCTAGDYAITKLRAPVAQRIYLWRAIGPGSSQPKRKSVQFSFAAPEGANTTPGYSLSVKHVGDNMTAAMAQQYCYDDLLIDP